MRLLQLLPRDNCQEAMDKMLIARLVQTYGYGWLYNAVAAQYAVEHEFAFPAAGPEPVDPRRV